uniref:VPS50 subunit of EARP/GARPII complex n=1 Tax=Oncorhynchus kisutch TaxID=8019 RepID=A0A8C7G8I7_ONCKI
MDRLWFLEIFWRVVFFLRASVSSLPTRVSQQLVICLSHLYLVSQEEMREMREQPIDPQAEQEIINSIQEVYYSNDSFDMVQHELEKLPPELNLQELEEYRDQLKRQQAAVKRVTLFTQCEWISCFLQELERVTSLQTNLQLAAVICTNARRQLSISKEDFTEASLGLLANQRRRHLLTGLLKSLRTIKTLQRTDVRLSEMLEEEDYPGAIQLCLECQKAASTFKHYSCIRYVKIPATTEQLDVALSKTCKHFDVSHYTRVQLAYTLLEKTQTAMDQLHMHFTQAIHNTVFQVVLGYVELCAGNADTKFQKMQYKDLCTHITQDSYVPCLSDLCKALWEVMLSYHRTMQWHEEQDNEEPPPTTGMPTGSNIMTDTEEAVVDHSYVKKKLEHGLTRIWQEVQLKVKAYLLGTDMSNFKYDDFIVVLDVISRLMQVGEEFCGSKSELLQESIKRQSVNYFKNYHRTRLEELRMFLENETWELCPVKSNFNIAQLHEFKFMGQSRSPSVSPSRQVLSSQDQVLSSKDQEVLSLFQHFSQEGNPFERHIDNKDEETEDVLASNGYESDELEKCVYQDYDSDSDVPDELKQDYVDEQTGDVPLKSASRETLRSRKKSDYSLNKGSNAPILTNTTLNVIRLVGKYIQMMNILKPIAFDVIHCVSQLFDYYLYAVYTFFGRNDMYESSGPGLISSRLRTTLNRIQESLIQMLRGERWIMANLSVCNIPIHPAKAPAYLAPPIPFHTPLTLPPFLIHLAKSLYCFLSRVFLAEQFEFLQSHLDTMMPAAKKPFLQQFYSQTVSTASELRKPIYWVVAAKALDYEQMLLLMAGVKWDIREIMSQHNVYVDVLLKEFEEFNKRLGDVSRHVRVPLPVSNVLWEHCIRLANRTLVEGYGNVKKCSNEGRALMQLDFQQFLMKLEKLTDMRPIPDKDFVETYIKAYYLTENDMEQFIKNHREYSMKQLANLVNVCLGSHINKKARQKLLAAIDDIDRPKR